MLDSNPRVSTKLPQWLILTSLFVALSACSYKNLGPDNDLAGNEQCKPPCWSGVTPGITAQADLATLLSSMEESNLGELYVSDAGAVSWLNTEGKRYYFYLEDNIVQRIWVYEVMNTKVDHLIELFGDPDGLVISFIDPHGQLTAADLYYPEQGLVFVVKTRLVSTSGIFAVDADSQVLSAIFVEPTNLQEMFINRCGEVCKNLPKSKVQPWSERNALVP